jgi:hypothetical protein
MSIIDKVDEKAWRNRVLAEYLKEYAVTPLGQEGRDKWVSYFDTHKNKKTVGAKVGGVKELKQVGQIYLLSFGERLRWTSENTYGIISKYFDDKNLMDLSDEFPVMLVSHGLHEAANVKLFDYVNMVIQRREYMGKRTLVLATKDYGSFGDVSFGDVVGAVDGNKGAEDL